MFRQLHQYAWLDKILLRCLMVNADRVHKEFGYSRANQDLVDEQAMGLGFIMFGLHFSLRGGPGTGFEGGVMLWKFNPVPLRFNLEGGIVRGVGCFNPVPLPMIKYRRVCYDWNTK